MKAMTPNEALQKFQNSIPSDVIECWNETISENMTVQMNQIISRFTLKQLSLKILQKKEVSFEYANQHGWFDLEEYFQKVGWKVTFDKPGYNESYESNYCFSALRS